MRLGELRQRLASAFATEFSPDDALRQCLPFVREPAATWVCLDAENRIGFQKAAFVGGEIRFDGQSFWNSPLSRIYQLNRDFVANKSTLVDLRGKFWNPIIEDLRAWLAFCQSLSANSERPAA